MKSAFKKMTGLAGAVLLTAALTVPAFAQTYDYSWNETWTGGSHIDSTFDSDEFSAILNDIQPGDTVTLTANLYSNVTYESEWYMKNSVLQNLEDYGGSDGAYSYELNYHDADGVTPIYNSSKVSGEGGGGLSDATAATGDEWIYVSSMPSKGTGYVTLSITFDGNSLQNDYQNALATIMLSFGAQEKTVNIETETIKETETSVETQKQTETETEKPSETVRTGDSTPVLLYAVICLGAAAILIIMGCMRIFGRKKQDSDSNS